MAIKTPKCVLKSQEKAFNKLVELHNGDQVAAFDEYEKNGNVVPDRASALVEDDILDNRFTLVDNPESNPVLLARSEAIKNAKAFLHVKITKLNKTVEKHPGWIPTRDELRSIYDEIDTVNEEETLVSLIIAGENMVKFALSSLDKFDTGEKTPTIENIKKLEESVSGLSILKDLSADMFENEENKAAFNSINAIIGNYEAINSRYLKQARKLIAKNLSGSFHKIIRVHEKKAEEAFNRTFKKNYAKSEQQQAKIDFINKYMSDNATAISLETEHYVHNMLIQTVDISTAMRYLVSPKDMNHEIMNIATESIDMADMEIWHKMNEVVDDSETINDDFVKYVGKTSNSKKQYDILLAKDREGNTIHEIINKGTLGYQEFEDKYIGVPEVWNMYQHLVKLVQEKDALVFNGSRLGFKLPYIEQSNVERAYSEGVMTFMKNSVSDVFKVKGKDTEFGNNDGTQLKSNNTGFFNEIYVNEAGNEKINIPLHYRNSSIDKNDQSFDIMTSLVLDYHNSLKFNTKTKTAMFLDVLKDVVDDINFIQVSNLSSKLKLNKATQEIHKKKGGSNLSIALEHLVRHRIHGITIEGGPTTVKIFKAVTKYTSMLSMAFNIPSGVTNILQGNAVMWIETAGGSSGLFGAKNVAKANAKYSADLFKIVSDMGNRVPKSDTNLLMRYFNVTQETISMNGKSYSQDNQLKRLTEDSVLMAASSLGEHALEGVTMYSVLDNIKVRDVNGNFLDKEFNPTTNRNEAIGVDSAVMIEDGKISFHPSVNSTERTSGVDIKDVTQISNIIQRAARDMFGNYAASEKSEFQRNVYGHLTTQMRGWVVPGVQKRWRGAGSRGIFSLKKEGFMKFEDMYNPENIHKLSYNPHSNQFEEGQYVTTYAFLRQALGEVRALKAIAGVPETWDKLSDYHKGNVKKTTTEIATFISFWLLSMMFDPDDDEDEFGNIYAAYITRRMYSELSSFVNPFEGIRVAKSPAMAIGTIESALRLIIAMTSPTDSYEGGRHVGENKLWHQTKKMIPIVKQMDRNIEDSYNFLKK